MSTLMSPPKIVTVPANGQISIGKEWAGRQIQIQQLNDSQYLISAGNFIPDHLQEYYSTEAKQQLAEFNEWEAEYEPKQTNLDELRERVEQEKEDK
jgi:hypothetical protein